MPDDMKISDIRFLLKDNDVFRIDTWTRILIVGLYTDMFLGFVAPLFKLSINTFSDAFTVKVILLYALFAIPAIALFTILTLLAYTLILRLHKRKKDEGISERILETYALLTKNSIADRLLREHRQNENNRINNIMLKVAMGIMLAIDPFIGLYLSHFTENDILYKFIFILLGILIISWEATNYPMLINNIYIDSECIAKIKEIVKEKTKLKDK